MGDSDRQILYCLLQIVIFCDWIRLFLEFVIDDVKSKVKIRLGLVRYHFYSFLKRLSRRFWKVFICWHNEFIVIFWKVLFNISKFLTKISIIFIFLLGILCFILAEFPKRLIEMNERLEKNVSFSSQLAFNFI